MFIWSFKWQAPLENVFLLYFRLTRYKYIAPKSILIISILVINIFKIQVHVDILEKIWTNININFYKMGS